MRALLFAFLVLLVATTAFAGQNPNIRAFITMAVDDTVYADPDAAPNAVTDVYLCFDTFGPSGGLTGVSLVLDFQCGGFVAGAADVSLFHPSAQTVIGGPDNLAQGWVFAAPECVFPGGDGILCVARIPWFYTGTPGDIVILPNPVDGLATVDCNNDIDIFAIRSNGALGQEVPVEESSWGSIKALYR